MSPERGKADRPSAAGQRSRPLPKQTREPELPEDLILIKLKYGSDCRTCGTELPEGTRAHWSPSTRSAVWCQGCVIALSAAPDPGGQADTPQARWEALCRYLSKCVLAEMADTLARFSDSESWFPHDAGLDVLVTGDHDRAAIPERLASRLEDTARHSTFIYGWPTLVAMSRQRKPMVAPLFVVSVRPERDGDKWIGHAESEPEFNLSVVAGELFDLSVKEEVDAVTGNGVPFGDAPSLVRLARTIAGVLGTSVVSDLDPRSLTPRCNETLGLHNTAIWVRADDGRNALGSLLDELEKLAHRRDWMETAAAHLIPGRPPPGKPVHRSPTEWLAAPVPCNDSQERTLERLRREPLTVVTGPPGTGKTQLVVNAVANAWLDRETVLLASTNNGAVDVAVERANEICPGMLLRTGRRPEREALAGRAAEAIAAATAREESNDDLEGVAREAQARAELARTAERWTRLVADLGKAAELRSKLKETVGDLDKRARRIWKRARAPESALDSERIERRARRLERAWFFRRWRTRRLLRSIGCEDPSIALGVLARWAAIDQARIVLMNDLSATEARIGDPDSSLRQAAEQWSEASKSAAFETVGAGFRGGKTALQALDRTNPGGGTFPKTLRSCRRHARGWACTALSMQRNFPLEPRLFDFALVDEASQCSPAVALPLAYRAKRLAVIGDPSQLAPIVTLPYGRLRAIAASEHLDDDDLEHRGLHYKEGSTYRAFECAIEPDLEQPVVLDEHYRSHPYIARWFNREFYRGALTVLTDTAGMSADERSIGWIDVRGEARRGETGSWVNAAEAEAAVRLLAEWIHGAAGSVGVVTPFTAQALLIRRLARRHPQLGEEVLTEVRLRMRHGAPVPGRRTRRDHLLGGAGTRNRGTDRVLGGKGTKPRQRRSQPRQEIAHGSGSSGDRWRREPHTGVTPFVSCRDTDSRRRGTFPVSQVPHGQRVRGKAPRGNEKRRNAPERQAVRPGIRARLRPAGTRGTAECRSRW